MVNNAGILRDNKLVRVKDGELVKQMPEKDFDAVIAVNLKGVFNCTQAFAPYMINQGEGVILNAEGQGPSARVQVNFERAGAKWLVVAYANLQPA